MASNGFPSSPLDPLINHHHPLSSPQRCNPSLPPQTRDPPDVQPVPEQTLPSELDLSDIPIQNAPISSNLPSTPISRWLRTVELVPPTGLRVTSYWSPDSDSSAEVTSNDSNCGDQEEQSPMRALRAFHFDRCEFTCGERDDQIPVRKFHNFEFNRGGHYSPEGISPTNPGHHAVDAQPVPGPSTRRVLPSESPLKRKSKTNPSGKPPGKGKKKHTASTYIPCRVPVVIPMSKLRSDKQAEKRRQLSPHGPLLAPSRPSPPPCEQPI
ncbi:hypothetical protein PTTG_04945 [Puccinia triticina 1-1 BBBD Race 1]|uniref:Uncharacterized protein n=1 Tax=Puccinia triticina (isolate 1-1 / race 1 (BBBD)) TaxID=630390 RepID=A0A0C4EVV9_PUCT1|nr:hypothetical protein PTTG_04945 [Puccinia triticina 1-1 BBBD Race 1]